MFILYGYNTLAHRQAALLYCHIPHAWKQIRIARGLVEIMFCSLGYIELNTFSKY